MKNNPGRKERRNAVNKERRADGRIKATRNEYKQKMEARKLRKLKVSSS